MEEKEIHPRVAFLGWQIAEDIILLLCLLVLSSYTVYFASEDLSQVYFLLLLVTFVFSKKDYFWFAFFFIVAQGPGYFFSNYSAESAYRLPFYTLLAGISFTPIDFFVFIALIKALVFGKKRVIQLQRPLIILMVYISFVLLLSAVIFVTSIDVIAWNIRWLFYYSTIVSFYYLVSRRIEVYKFIALLFPIVGFILFTQIYLVGTGREFVSLFDPTYRSMTMIVLTGAIRPYVGGVLLVFFCYVFGLFMLVNDEWKWSKAFLYLTICMAFLSIFISATRQWFVAFLLVMVGYVILTKKRIFSAIGVVTILLVALGLLTYSDYFQSNFQLQSAWLRLEQVFDVFGGDIKAVDTAENRFFNQLPIIMGVIKQNPFLGYGFSSVTMRFYDNDLGFVNTILMFGCIGFLFFLYFFIKLLGSLLLCARKLSEANAFKLPLYTMFVAWLGILVIYFSTQDFFTFYFNKVFFVSIMIALTEFFLRQASKEEIVMNIENNHPVGYSLDRGETA